MVEQSINAKGSQKNSMLDKLLCIHGQDSHRLCWKENSYNKQVNINVVTYA